MPTAAVGQITITDLKDTVGLVLSNEVMTVAAAPDGTVASLSGVATTATILLGGVDDSANWTLTAGTASGMTGALSGKTYTVTGVSADTAYVDLTASRTGYASLTKRFSVSKSRQGVQGATGATGAPGVNGTSPVTVTLSNTAHTVPTDSAGNNGNFSGCATTLNVFNGITNDSANWTVTAAATNLTGSLSGKTYTVTALSADSGYVDLTADRSGFTSQTVRFTVTKAKAGVAGQTPTAYWLVRSAGAVRKSVAGTYTPAALTFTAKSQTGTAAPANYAGRFVISTSTDGTTWTAAYTSAADESSKAYTVPASIAAVKVVLYQAGGTSTVLDEEIIPVVVDGATGAQGAQGAQGVQGPTVTITANRALSFTSTDGTLDASQTDIVFTAATTGITSPTYAWSFTGLQANPTASTTASQTITAAQFGTSRSATVTCIVGTYKETLTIVRLEKSTAAAGATVGATWGTNVSSIPSNISTAGSTPTVDLRNSQIGLNASGQLYGAGAGNGTTVSNAQISVNPATGVIGGIGTGAGTAVANSQVAFSARQTWEFRGSAEGWTAVNAAIAANADTITVTATNTDQRLIINGLNINGSVYDKLRMRVRRVAGSGWDGIVFYSTSATSPNPHGESASYYKQLPNPLVPGSFVMLEWDMANLTVGGNDWTASTITMICFDLGSTASDVFEIDWISVGKYGHDVDLVLSASSQIIAGTETNGVILDAASKSLQVVTGGNERVRLGNQAAAVNGSAYGFVVKDNGGNVVFDSRNAVGIVGNQAHDNYNLGDSSTNPFWNSNTNGVGNVAIGALALRGDGLAEASGRSFNVAIGYQALRYTTVGTNIAIGNQAGRGNPAGFSGGDNTVIGYNAMVWGTTGAKNVAIGRGALRYTTSGSENTAVGYLSQSTGDIASYNTSLGSLSLRVATGSENTSVGHNSGYSLNTGSNNTFVGKDAGYTITTGSGNTFIGYKAYTDANQNNQTIIASGAGVVLKHSGSLLETSHNFSSGGNITATGTVKGGAITVEGSGPMICLLATDAAQSNFWIHANSSKFYVLTDYDYDGSWEAPNPLVLDNATTTASIYGQKAWTAGNDGADSGLDADLLDGQHGSYYLSWANFTGKPTTLSGYGITDAASSSHAHTYASLSSKPTSPQGFSMVPEEMPASIDLDTKTATGWYSQANTTEATVALHYPVALAGLLEVFAYSAMVHQRYWVYNSNDVYCRAKYSTGAWTAWIKSVNVDDNVATATKLAASKTINGVAFDGSANITVADSTKLPLAGGTMTGAITFAGAQTWPTFNQSTTGSAASLTTGRTLTIGSTGKTFNGTASVSWTLAEIGAAPATHSHTQPVSGNWFNTGFLSISTGGAVEVGRYFDWHYNSTDTTDYTARTEIDSAGNLIHSQGLRVKNTGGLGYAFGGAVTQLTSRDTGVTLNTPSGTITLATVATTTGTLNKFTLTNSCIAATDVVMVCMQNSGTGRYNVFVDRVAAGSCDIRLQNQATTASESCSINFVIIKGSNS